eukprot:TRINITY_DN60256_c0_g1_i1.p1 TRINITY_DN60256_c0_g1~~TRINITY_DN60256_c0_g1_i1.p1  ORF type:complete len:505 (+),score=54.66 TRINITY_DN60256_c0_g1_i1:63-1577(+)
MRKSSLRETAYSRQAGTTKQQAREALLGSAPAKTGFSSSSARAIDVPEASRAPAPGWYDHPPEHVESVRLCDPSFRSKVERRVVASERNSAGGPGPGSYEVRPPSRKSPQYAWAVPPSRRGRLNPGRPSPSPAEMGAPEIVICALGGGGDVSQQSRAQSSRSSRPSQRVPIKELFGTRGTGEDEIFMWIGTDPNAPPTHRGRRVVRATTPMSVFASSTPRTRPAPSDSTQQPGPGHYEELGFVEAGQRSNNLPQSAFSSTAGMNKRNGIRETFDIGGNTSPDLGPGSYEVDEPSTPTSLWPVPFGACQPRWTQEKLIPTPGPGYYDDSKLGSAAWERSGSSCSQATTATPTPPVGFGSRQERVCPVFTPCSCSPESGRDTPVLAPNKLLDSAARRALRLAANYHPQAEPPGPGYYDDSGPQRTLIRNQPVDEGFLHTQPRFDEREELARCMDPGPGFYTPRVVMDPSPISHDFGLSPARFANSPCDHTSGDDEKSKDFVVRGHR